METLDEFDNEYPLSMSFCKLISPEDFEVQSLSYTEQCLQELYTNMEQSPGICERVMRKRKQMEKEAAGLASFLKAKFFWTLQGEMNYCNYVGIAEMQEKVLQLKRDLQKVNNYARGNPCASVSIRVTRQDLFPLVCSYRTTTSPPSGSPCPQRARVNNRGLRMVDLHPIVLNPGGFQASLQAGNHINKLRYTTTHHITSPCPKPSPQKAGPSDMKSTPSVFDTPMLSKFQGGSEDDMDNEKPGPSSPPKGA
uniref:Uncharacterized protein n=1 Tax=Chelydra serpentina TaxID=8475 RepID=A0A8C3STQ0_CHESE